MSLFKLAPSVRPISPRCYCWFSSFARDRLFLHNFFSLTDPIAFFECAREGADQKVGKEAQENILSRATPTFCATLTPSEKLWAREPSRSDIALVRWLWRPGGAKLISLCGDAENPTAQEPSASFADSPRVEWLNRITCCQSQLERDGSREHPHFEIAIFTRSSAHEFVQKF